MTAEGLELYLSSSPLLSIAASFAAGFLTSLTPCIYPVIPVTVAYTGARNERSRTRAFAVSVVYVLGMASVYAALGLAAALSGSMFGQVQTNPWTNFAVGNILIFFGLSVLDVFSFGFASFKASNAGGSKGFLGAFGMGALAGTVAAPCTAAVLGVILTYVATTRDVLLGAATLFSFALGMGVLLVAIGTFSGIASSLPKPGPWMERLKKLFGILMILAGEYFILKAGSLWLF